MCRLGQNLAFSNDDFHDLTITDFVKIAEEEMNNKTIKLSKILTDIEFINMSMEHLQVVISNSIEPKRIIKIIGQGDITGRVKKRKIKDKINLKQMKKDLH
jgi:hypothetical protein